MAESKHEAFKAAYASYPSQDNEGYQPDRAGFKAGFSAGAAWAVEEAAKAAEKWWLASHLSNYIRDILKRT